MRKTLTSLVCQAGISMGTGLLRTLTWCRSSHRELSSRNAEAYTGARAASRSSNNKNQLRSGSRTVHSKCISTCKVNTRHQARWSWQIVLQLNSSSTSHKTWAVRGWVPRLRWCKRPHLSTVHTEAKVQTCLLVLTIRQQSLLEKSSTLRRLLMVFKTITTRRTIWNLSRRFLLDSPWIRPNKSS